MMKGHDVMIRAREGETIDLNWLAQKMPAIFADHPHESRSQRYVYVSTADVIHRLVSEGFYPVEARVNRARTEEKQNYTRHMVRFRKMDGDITRRRVGDTALEVCLRNAHDGSASYEFFAGLFRLVCLNGMVVSDGQIEAVRVRHSGNRQKILDDVVVGAESIIAQAPIVLEAPRKWSEITLKPAEQLAFANSAHLVRFGDDSPVEPKQLLIANRSADQGDDLWHTFNRIQENVTRGVSYIHQRTYRHRQTREIKSIDRDVKVNRALWQLAEHMAELKTAA